MKESKLEKAISVKTAQRVYDLLGKRYDWFGGFDARAKSRSIKLLDLAPGMSILEVGVGTGKVLTEISSAIAPDGKAFGIDLSKSMLAVSCERNVAHLCQADARNIPFISSYFDRIYISYVLDLISLTDIACVLAESKRSLKSNGLIVIVALTEGVDVPSRALVTLWKAAYNISPVSCAGCRPLMLSKMLVAEGFKDVQREVIVQLGVPSEIVTATK
jgi:S-adenosylmethionine-diacylgycerolhomoserine-N-methlytransferase